MDLQHMKCVNHEKCGGNALCLYAGKWVCGKCLDKTIHKLNEMKEKFIFEE